MSHLSASIAAKAVATTAAVIAAAVIALAAALAAASRSHRLHSGFDEGKPGEPMLLLQIKRHLTE